jgi:trimethylamine:corrinoid methyltransferase-like protein
MQWQKNGSLDTQARAMLRVRDILSHDSTALFSPAVDARIRAEYTDLISGKLEIPEGW